MNKKTSLPGNFVPPPACFRYGPKHLIGLAWNFDEASIIWNTKVTVLLPTGDITYALTNRGQLWCSDRRKFLPITVPAPILSALMALKSNREGAWPGLTCAQARSHLLFELIKALMRQGALRWHTGAEVMPTEFSLAALEFVPAARLSAQCQKYFLTQAQNLGWSQRTAPKEPYRRLEGVLPLFPTGSEDYCFALRFDYRPCTTRYPPAIAFVSGQDGSRTDAYLIHYFRGCSDWNLHLSLKNHSGAYLASTSAGTEALAGEMKKFLLQILLKSAPDTQAARLIQTILGASGYWIVKPLESAPDEELQAVEKIQDELRNSVREVLCKLSRTEGLDASRFEPYLATVFGWKFQDTKA